MLLLLVNGLVVAYFLQVSQIFQLNSFHFIFFFGLKLIQFNWFQCCMLYAFEFSLMDFFNNRLRNVRLCWISSCPLWVCMCICMYVTFFGCFFLSSSSFHYFLWGEIWSYGDILQVDFNWGMTHFITKHKTYFEEPNGHCPFLFLSFWIPFYVILIFFSLLRFALF